MAQTPPPKKRGPEPWLKPPKKGVPSHGSNLKKRGSWAVALKVFRAMAQTPKNGVPSHGSNSTLYCTFSHDFMTPRPENGRKFFWWPIGVQNYQGTHRNWFWPFFEAPRGPFSKNPKIYVFQISNFPGQFSRLLLDLESWNFFWYALILCLADSSIPHCLVWFGLNWYVVPFLKKCSPEKSYR